MRWRLCSNCMFRKGRRSQSAVIQKHALLEFLQRTLLLTDEAYCQCSRRIMRSPLVVPRARWVTVHGRPEHMRQILVDIMAAVSVIANLGVRVAHIEHGAINDFTGAIVQYFRAQDRFSIEYRPRGKPSPPGAEQASNQYFKTRDRFLLEYGPDEQSSCTFLNVRQAGYNWRGPSSRQKFGLGTAFFNCTGVRLENCNPEKTHIFVYIGQP